MNALDPKARFLRSGESVGRHRQLCGSPEFLSAIDAALLRYNEQLVLNQSDNRNKSAANHHKLIGAHEFVKVLLNLGEKAELPEKPKSPSLDYKA